MSPTPAPLDLTADQKEEWRSAQRLWGIELHAPLESPHAGKGTFAWFSFPPQVWFDLDDESARGLDGYLESIFAHEIGHHVLSPSTRQDSLKIVHQMARALSATDPLRPDVPTARAHEFSNLWSDMLINVRVAELQRRRDPSTPPQMIGMWQVLSAGRVPSRQWWVVLRAYERLWSKPPGTLCPIEPVPAPQRAVAAKSRALHETDPGADDPESLGQQTLEQQFEALVTTDPELDASLLASAVRTFGDDPVSGALSFGMIMAPYVTGLGDDVQLVLAGSCGGQLGETPATKGELAGILGDARLAEHPEHPALRAAEARAGAAGTTAGDGVGIGSTPAASSGGQGYGLADTLALYVASDADGVLAAWYESRARRWVKPLLQAAEVPATSTETIPGALERWEVGDDLADVDWAATLATSPTVVPGVTTRRREILPDVPPAAKESVELDLYIDSSASMLSPEAESPAVLAGTILLLSVLRGGGRVRVTSFSSAGSVAGGERYTRDRAEAMRYLVTYFGGGTTFPLDLYASRYRSLRTSTSAPQTRRHVVILSDEGLQSLFGEGQPGLERVASEVRRQLDSGTVIVMDPSKSTATAADEAGYDVEYIDDMSQAPAACSALAGRLARGGTTRG